MQPVKLNNSQIIDYRTMKQSGLVRITLELNENDSVKYCGTLAIAERNRLLVNSEMEFTQIQGENNGHEDIAGIAERETDKTLAGGDSIYKKFRDKCIEYSGEEFYESQKRYFNVQHLKDLERDYPLSAIEKMLTAKMIEIDKKMGIGVLSNKSAGSPVARHQVGGNVAENERAQRSTG